MNRQILAFFYIVTMGVALVSSNGVMVAIGIAWCMIALTKYISCYHSSGYRNRINSKFIYSKFFFPALFLHAYAIFLVLIGISDKKILSTNLVTYVPILLTVSSVYLFRKRVIIYDFIIVLVAFGLSAVSRISSYGLTVITESVKHAFFIKNADSYLEINDTVHAIGYMWIFYLFSSHKTKKRTIVLLCLMFIAFMLGLKRISLLAILGVTVVFLFVPWRKPKHVYRFCILGGILTTGLCITYLLLISNQEVFNNLLNSYHIDSMARNAFYERLLGMTRFSPSFLGYGRGSVRIVMLENFNIFEYVHSDIIKMYFENGFVLFLAWLLFYCVYMIKAYKGRYSEKASLFYLFVMMYTIILFLTDNTESYFACRLIRTTLPFVYATYYSYDSYTISLKGKRDYKRL